MNATRLRAGRDLSRRRLLLLGISGLTLLATIPIVAHHALGSGANLLEGRDNIGNLCLVALHIILAPVHSGFHIALILGLLYAAVDRGLAWARLNRGIDILPVMKIPSSGPFPEAITAAGIDPARVRIVAGLANPAFTAGWWSPRIYLAAELSQRLSGPELECLVAHERAHLKRRDPLRLAVLRFFACLLFWIPALRKLAADVADEAEFEADDVAANGKPLVLASAILNVALWRESARTAAAVGFIAHDLVEERVRRLSGEIQPSRSHVTSRSLIAATAMLAAVLSSGIVVAHPLRAAQPVAETHSGMHGRTSGTAHRGKCRGHHELVILHLLCGGVPFGLSGVDCPDHHISAPSRFS